MTQRGPPAPPGAHFTPTSIDAEKSRQCARNGRKRTGTSQGESNDRAAGRLRRQLPDAVVPDAVVLVRPLLDELDELDEVVYPISAAIWAD